MARIVDSILVDDEGPDQSTELDQRVPVAPVAGEPRCLDCEHGADGSSADPRQQALEARPRDPAAGATEIIVDDLDSGPAELPRAIGELILAPPAFLVVHELIGRRLADVEKGAAREMVNRDLRHRRPPRLPAPRRSRAAEPPPMLTAAPSGQELALSEDLCGRAKGPAVGSRRSASCSAFSIPESDRRKPKSASSSARRARNTSTGKLGAAQTLCCAAALCVIHVGMQATEPSGCGMTTTSVPRYAYRLMMITASPHRG